MNDDLALIFARIHADYRAAVAMTVHNLPDEALAAISEQFMAMETQLKEVTFANIPDEAWPVAGRVRIEVRRELKRRQEADKEQDA